MEQKFSSVELKIEKYFPVQSRISGILFSEKHNWSITNINKTIMMMFQFHQYFPTTNSVPLII